MTLPRLIFVTGAGGSGKSTVAAALALALSRRHPTTLVSLDGGLCAPRLLDAAANGGSGLARGRENLEALTLGARAELEAFVERVVPIKTLSRRMLQSGTFERVAAALPGLQALLVLERLRSMAATGKRDGRRLVVDAPASASAMELLLAAARMDGIAPAGMLERMAGAVKSFLQDEARFGVMLTVRPEELAVREVLEFASAVRERLGARCAGAILNRASRMRFSGVELQALAPLKAHAGLALRREALAERVSRARDDLRAAGLSVVEMPMLFRPELGRCELQRLGDRLEAELPEG